MHWRCKEGKLRATVCNRTLFVWYAQKEVNLEEDGETSR
jgi:hypothetical protein